MHHGVFLYIVLILLDASPASSRTIASVPRPFTIDVVRGIRENNPQLDRRDQGTAPSNSHPGYVWTAPVSIGNPPQNFNIEIDTGSGDFWVLGPEASVYGPVYNPDISQSWRNGTIGVAVWHAAYSGGGEASGYIGHDDVTVGSLKIANAMLEVSRESSWGGTGLIGLAPTFADPKKCNIGDRFQSIFCL